MVGMCCSCLNTGFCSQSLINFHLFLGIFYCFHVYFSYLTTFISKQRKFIVLPGILAGANDWNSLCLHNSFLCNTPFIKREKNSVMWSFVLLDHMGGLVLSKAISIYLLSHCSGCQYSVWFVVPFIYVCGFTFLRRKKHYWSIHLATS